MAVLIEPLLKQKVNTARLLKMIIIHDLVEAEASDISALDILRNPEIKTQKTGKEKQKRHPPGVEPMSLLGENATLYH
jgi:putative hydrolase of HD superfamily